MIIKKRIILLIFILCIIMTNGCNTQYSQKQLDEMSTNIVENYTLPYAQDGGVNMGLFDTNGEIVDDRTFNLKKGDKFNKIISIGNMFDHERNYKIILFVNYKQSSFLVNGNEVFQYDYEANEYENFLVPIEISDFEEGLNDVFFIIVKYPDIQLLDDEFRKHTDMNNLLYLRFNVFVESNVQPTLHLNEFENLTETEVDGILLSKEKDVLKRWLTEDVTISEKVNYNIHVGNQSFAKNQKFAVITLLDWQQVDFFNNQDVVFFDLEKGKKTYIPSSITAPSENGIYDLVSILIYDPYVSLDDSNSFSEMETGIRVGINVK